MYISGFDRSSTIEPYLSFARATSARSLTPPSLCEEVLHVEVYQYHGADGTFSGSFELSLHASMVIWCGVSSSYGSLLSLHSRTLKHEYAENKNSFSCV